VYSSCHETIKEKGVSNNGKTGRRHAAVTHLAPALSEPPDSSSAASEREAQLEAEARAAEAEAMRASDDGAAEERQ
jgi:hypothetical protein